MKRIVYSHLLTGILLTAVLFFSCIREFDNNSDYRYNTQELVLGDNALLYSKVFRCQSSGNYLWFDLRNEVANFTRPVLPVSFLQNGVERYNLIDLRGRLYEYSRELSEVTFLNIPLNLFGTGELPVNLVCALVRKQKDRCSDLADMKQRELCERSYILQLKRIGINEYDRVISVGESYTHEYVSVVLTAQTSQEFLLTN